MRLYYFPVAPNPTKVRLYLAEKGIGVEQIAVDLRAGEQQSPDFLRKNPMGKLPVLELDDGTAVNESLAIIEYFEELHPDPPMIGRTPEERLKVRALERHCDIGILVNLARVVHATHSPLTCNCWSNTVASSRKTQKAPSLSIPRASSVNWTPASPMIRNSSPSPLPSMVSRPGSGPVTPAAMCA